MVTTPPRPARAAARSLPGAALAVTGALSQQVGQQVTFAAAAPERIGEHSLAVTAPEAGSDPALVHGALLPADLDVGTERFAGTPAVVAGTARTLRR